MRWLVLAFVCSASAAHAYPQFQLSTGATRCNVCHVSPAGGGILTSYGREEAADTISAGGDGRFLHGLWTPPKWLSLGGDFRVAGIVNDVGATEGVEMTAFPMQMDLYGSVRAGAFSATFTLGLRGSTRYTYQRPASIVVSDEHYLMWRPQPAGPYLRAGRFLVPFGLRVAEHPFYIRRYLGQNTLEEPYAISGGLVYDGWEAHLSFFTPTPLYPVGFRGTGSAVYVEKRFGQKAAAAAQMRVAVGADDTRLTFGGVGKYWIEEGKLLLLSELDVVRQIFDDLDADRTQLAAHLGATWMFRRGFMLSAVVEAYLEDVAVEGTDRKAVSLELQWFPTAHLELLLLGRSQVIGGDPANLLMLQVHYYL
jgi:hypothetical protein